MQTTTTSTEHLPMVVIHNTETGQPHHPPTVQFCGRAVLVMTGLALVSMIATACEGMAGYGYPRSDCYLYSIVSVGGVTLAAGGFLSAISRRGR